MAGALTKLLLTFLPSQVVFGAQRKIQHRVFEFKNPKAIQITNPKRDYYDYQYHTHWCNPNFPKIGHAVKVAKKDEVTSNVFNNLDKLPEEFFINRGIEDHRVPFDYWFPMWKDQFRRRLKNILWGVFGITIAIVLPIILTILNIWR
ncbi:MAG: hypothetical protein NC218_03640 [Acetobacter sp.]|nr:hypothetical protein [Acetobacter sp.]